MNAPRYHRTLCMLAADVMLVLTSMFAASCVFCAESGLAELHDRNQRFSLPKPRGAAQLVPNFTLEHIGIEQGFLDQQVRCIMQDNRGFLWVGTEGGVSVYNGNTFTTYVHNRLDSTSLASTTVNAIVQDHTGTIWLGTLNGLDRFCGTTKRFYHYRPVVQQFTDDLQKIHALHQASDQRLWIGTDKGIVIFAPQSSSPEPHKPHEHWEHILLPIRSSLETRSQTLHRNTRVMSIGSTKSGLVWCISFDGDIWIIHPTTKRISFVAETSPLSFQPQTAFRNDTLWVGTEQGVFCVDMVAKQIVGQYLSAELQYAASTAVHAVCWSQQGLIWAGTDNGIYVIEPRTGQVQHIRDNPAEPSGLRGNVVTAIYEDRSGILWIGNGVVGMSKFSPWSHKFRTYRNNPFNPNSLSNDYVRGLYEDQQGLLWVGTQYGGLNSINRHTGSITRFQYQPSNPNSLPSNNVWAIIPDQRGATRGNMWVGMDRKGGIALFSPARPEAGFRKFRASGFAEDASVQVMYEDQAGNIWVGTWSDSTEIYRIAPDRQTVELFTRPKLQIADVQGKPLPGLFECVGVQSFCEDSHGRLWIGGNSGLLYFKPNAKQMVYYPLSEAVALHAQALSNNTVRDFVTFVGETRDSTLWVATKGSGVYFVKTQDAEQGRFTHLSSADGLPHDNVYAVLEDASGKLWMSTDNGVCEYHRVTKTFRTFGIGDGLQGREFNRRAFFRSASGEMLFGGTRGLSSFFPEQTTSNPHAPSAIIERVMVLHSKKILFDVLASDLPQTVELDYSDKSIHIDVAATEYTAPANNLYSWKLEGFDKQWSEPTTHRHIVYTNLEPGTYTFRIIVANSDGVWNREEAKLTLKVLPAWWQRWWLRAAVVLVVSVLLWQGYVVRVQRVQERTKRRNQELQSLVEERTKELHEQAQKIESQRAALQEQNAVLNTTLLDLQRTQSQLVHSERMSAIGLLTAGIMHEVNNPNAAIYSALEEAQLVLQNLHRLFLSLVPEEERQNPLVQSFEHFVNELHEMTTVALHGSRRVREVVANLRNFTKHQRSSEITGNIAEELRSTVQMFRYQFKHVRVEILMPDTIIVRGNIGELNQVFLNLLVNAAQAGATCIVVTAEEYWQHTQPHTDQHNTDQRWMKLTVQDNGSGMTPEVQQRIFEPFFSTKDVGNSGLGLSISKDIIHKHGGFFDVRSAVGQGTTFTLHLRL